MKKISTGSQRGKDSRNSKGKGLEPSSALSPLQLQEETGLSPSEADGLTLGSRGPRVQVKSGRHQQPEVAYAIWPIRGLSSLV